MLSLIRKFNKSEHILVRKSVILLLVALAIASDLIGLEEDHCHRQDSERELLGSGDETTIINGANGRNPLEQYYQCDKKEVAKCQACELYSTSNSHYGPIVSFQQIPSGAASQRVAPASSSRPSFIAAVDKLARTSSSGSSRSGSEAPFDWCDNDNQTTSNESQESREREISQLRLGTRMIITLSHSRNSMPKPETTKVRFNRIKSSLLACSHGSRQTVCCGTKPKRPPQPMVRRRKCLAWPAITRAEAIRLVRLEAPHSIPSGQLLKLRCLYETKGDKLQSLAWYRNGREFYRYQPFERRQPVLSFNSTGVHVDMSRSRNHTVYLTNTTLETSGRFRCEATGTTFQEAKLETYIEVKQSASSSGTYLDCKMTQMMILLVAITQLASNLFIANSYH